MCAFNCCGARARSCVCVFGLSNQKINPAKCISLFVNRKRNNHHSAPSHIHIHITLDFCASTNQNKHDVRPCVATRSKTCSEPFARAAAFGARTHATKGGAFYAPALGIHGHALFFSIGPQLEKT